MRVLRTVTALGMALGLSVLACSNSESPTAIEIDIAALQINSGVCAIPEGATCPVLATALTAEGIPVSNPVLRWSSSNPTVAAVTVGSTNLQATVHGRAVGSATVRVENTTGDVFDDLRVNVLLCSKC